MDAHCINRHIDGRLELRIVFVRLLQPPDTLHRALGLLAYPTLQRHISVLDSICVPVDDPLQQRLDVGYIRRPRFAAKEPAKRSHHVRFLNADDGFHRVIGGYAVLWAQAAEDAEFGEKILVLVELVGGDVVTGRHYLGGGDIRMWVLCGIQ